MDVREKLVELIEQSGACFDCFPVAGYEKDEIEKIASHLIAHGVTVQEWISVKDRLPKGGAIVLCNTNYFVEVLQWDERADVWVDQYRNYRKNYVTHWMPLPNAPEVKND